MTEQKSRNPLEIKEGDGLGTIVTKAFVGAAIQTVAVYGGMLGGLAVVGYVADKWESRKKEKQEEKELEEQMDKDWEVIKSRVDKKLNNQSESEEV